MAIRRENAAASARSASSRWRAAPFKNGLNSGRAALGSVIILRIVLPFPLVSIQNSTGGFSGWLCGNGGDERMSEKDFRDIRTRVAFETNIAHWNSGKRAEVLDCSIEMEI